MPNHLQIVLTLLLTIVNCQDLHEFLGLNVPFFNHSSDVVFTAQEGGVAYISCEVYNLNNKSVSWVRGRDSHILTVDRETFISDRRFISMHRKEKMSDIVTLLIHGVRIEDQGSYECQVSAEHKISKWVELVVLQPQVKILGDPDIHVKEGSSVKLKCVISNIVEKPAFVTWFLNEKMLVDFAGDLSDLTHSSTHSLSTLYLPSVDLADSGNYSCQPASLHKVSITLHVLKAEKEQKLSVKETSDSVSHSHLRQIVLLVLNLCIIYQP